MARTFLVPEVPSSSMIRKLGIFGTRNTLAWNDFAFLTHEILIRICSQKWEVESRGKSYISSYLGEYNIESYNMTHILFYSMEMISTKPIWGFWWPRLIIIFRKYLSTRNLLIATCLMTIGGLVYVLWITTRIVVLYPLSIRRLDGSNSHKYSMIHTVWNYWSYDWL